MILIDKIKEWLEADSEKPLKSKPKYLTKDMLYKALEYWENANYSTNPHSGLCSYFHRYERRNGVSSSDLARFLIANNYINNFYDYYDTGYKLEPRVKLLKELIARWDNE